MNKNKLFNRIYENTYNSEKPCSEVPVAITTEGNLFFWVNSDVFAELGVKTLNYNWGYKNGTSPIDSQWIIEEDEIEDAITSAKKVGLSFADDRDFAGTFKYLDSIYKLTDISNVCIDLSDSIYDELLKRGEDEDYDSRELTPRPIEEKAMFKDGYIIVPLDKPLSSVGDVDMAEYINDYNFTINFADNSSIYDLPIERLDCNYGDKEVIYKLNPKLVDITWEEWKNMFDR